MREDDAGVDRLIVEILNLPAAAGFDELGELPELSEDEAAALAALPSISASPAPAKKARGPVRQRCGACERVPSPAELCLCAACLGPHHAACFAELGVCAACGSAEAVAPGASGRAKSARRRSWIVLPMIFVAGGLSAAALHRLVGPEAAPRPSPALSKSAAPEPDRAEAPAPAMVSPKPPTSKSSFKPRNRAPAESDYDPDRRLMITDLRLITDINRLEAGDAAEFKLDFWNLSPNAMTVIAARIFYSQRRNYPAETELPLGVPALEYLDAVGPIVDLQGREEPWEIPANGALQLRGRLKTFNKPELAYPRRIVGQVVVLYRDAEGQERRFWSDTELKLTVLPD